MLNRWIHIGQDGQRTELAHIEHHYAERAQAQWDASALIAHMLALPDDKAPQELDDPLQALRDVDHARAMARAKAAARPTWEQEKRWFKESLARKKYAEATGMVQP